MGKREARRWNVACDYAINPTLLSAGFKLPGEPLFDQKFVGLSAEEIYAQLPVEKSDEDASGGGESDPAGQSTGSKSPQSGLNRPSDEEFERGAELIERTKQDPGGCGSVIPIKDKKEAKEQEQKWAAAVSQAASMTAGTMSDGLSRLVKKSLAAPLPWYVLLRDLVEKTARNDYDWTRPSRRHIHRGFILPSLISEELPEVIIAVDTSGSIDEKALSRFAEEASAVLGAYDTTVRVVYCDTKVRGEQIFTKADMPMELKPVGGGGTRFSPVFSWVEQQGHTPACLIYFTDLYGTFPVAEPVYPVMWVTETKNRKAPWGETVLFPMN
jgi:predicted metal-dependent peptidase